MAIFMAIDLAVISIHIQLFPHLCDYLDFEHLFSCVEVKSVQLQVPVVSLSQISQSQNQILLFLLMMMMFWFGWNKCNSTEISFNE